MGVVIVDCEVGNLNSVRKTLARLNVDCTVSSSPGDISGAAKLIIPGVGHFETAMSNLQRLNLIDVLDEFAMRTRRPVLGICLGMQLMAAGSEEGSGRGLSWFEAEVVKFRVRDKLRYKVPHVGWNQAAPTRRSEITKNLPDSSSFYFLHGYHLEPRNAEDVVCETVYEYSFPSAVQRENLFGVQFHPEKSHDAGEILLKNFLDL